jgi:hypothetical protein
MAKEVIEFFGDYGDSVDFSYLSLNQSRLPSSPPRLIYTNVEKPGTDILKLLIAKGT